MSQHPKDTFTNQKPEIWKNSFEQVVQPSAQAKIKEIMKPLNETNNIELSDKCIILYKCILIVKESTTITEQRKKLEFQANIKKWNFILSCQNSVQIKLMVKQIQLYFLKNQNLFGNYSEKIEPLCTICTKIRQERDNKPMTTLQLLETQYFIEKYKVGKNQIEFSRKVNGVQFGNIIKINLPQGKFVRYYSKSHSIGESKDTLNANIVDLKELLVYTFLSKYGISPEVHFLSQGMKNVYIATKDAALTKQNEQGTFYTYQSLTNNFEMQKLMTISALFTGLTQADILCRIFKLGDVLNNQYNFGLCERNSNFDFKIIDFRIICPQYNDSDKIVENWLNGNGKFNYNNPIITKVIRPLTKEQSVRGHQAFRCFIKCKVAQPIIQKMDKLNFQSLLQESICLIKELRGRIQKQQKSEFREIELQNFETYCGIIKDNWKKFQKQFIENKILSKYQLPKQIKTKISLESNVLEGFINSPNSIYTDSFDQIDTFNVKLKGEQDKRMQSLLPSLSQSIEYIIRKLEEQNKQDLLPRYQYAEWLYMLKNKTDQLNFQSIKNTFNQISKYFKESSITLELNSQISKIKDKIDQIQRQQLSKAKSYYRNEDSKIEYLQGRQTMFILQEFSNYSKGYAFNVFRNIQDKDRKQKVLLNMFAYKMLEILKYGFKASYQIDSNMKKIYKYTTIQSQEEEVQFIPFSKLKLQENSQLGEQIKQPVIIIDILTKICQIENCFENQQNFGIMRSTTQSQQFKFINLQILYNGRKEKKYSVYSTWINYNHFNGTIINNILHPKNPINNTYGHDRIMAKQQLAKLIISKKQIAQVINNAYSQIDQNQFSEDIKQIKKKITNYWNKFESDLKKQMEMKEEQQEMSKEEKLKEEKLKERSIVIKKNRQKDRQKGIYKER